jgi:hypothetical protein
MWSVLAATLFVIFLTVPAFMGHTTSAARSHRALVASPASASGGSKWVLPPALLVSLFGTGFSLDTNSVAPIASSIGNSG